MRYLGLFLLNLMVTGEFWSLYNSPDDEAVTILGARRILEGELPYRDFSTHIAPGSYWLTAAWVGLWGISVLSTRCLFGLVSALTSILIFACSARVLKGPVRYLPWLLWTSGGVMEFPVLSYHWMASAAIMAGWLAGLRWTEKGGRGPAALCGFCLALAGWILQSAGLSLTLLFVLVWFRFRPAGVVWLGLSAALSSLFLWAPHLSHLNEVWLTNVSAMREHFEFNANPYSWAQIGKFAAGYTGINPSIGLVRFLAAVEHLGFTTLRYATMPVLVLAAVIGAWRRGQVAEQVVSLGLTVWVLANVYKLSYLYLSFLNPGWCLVFVMVLSWAPAARWLLALLAATECCGWLLRMATRREAYVQAVNTRIGLYWALPAEGQTANLVGGWLGDIPPGTPCLAFPYACRFYVHFRLKNPIREPVIPPGLLPPASYTRARSDLVRQRTPYLLYLGADWNTIESEYRWTRAEMEPRWEALREQMTEGYRLRLGNPGLGFYVLAP